MITVNFSDMMIDPEIDVSLLTRVATRMTAVPYKFSASFRRQAEAGA
jgi:hypothetical protein